MTFAAPLFAWIGGAAAVAVVGLHLLAWRRPPETPLPTARFAPERPIRMVSRALRPADRLLLALRTALVLLAGFALAGPRFEHRRAGSARVVVVDRSNGARARDEIVSAARRELRAGDGLVVFDTAAREIDPRSLDSATASLVSSPGALSPAIVTAIRTARRLDEQHDSVEIVVVSPFLASEVDEATAAIRSLWRGPVRRVRVPSASDSAGAAAVPHMRGDPGDGVIAAVALNGAIAAGDRVHLIRDSLVSADSALARTGATIVLWPTAAGARWSARPRADTAMAVAVTAGAIGAPGENATVVATFERASTAPDGRVIARWADGAPAASEIPLGAGCIRSIAIDVPTAGDLALTPSFRRFARRITEPCGGTAFSALPDSVLDRVIPASVRVAAASVASRSPSGLSSRLTAWLLGLALAAAAAEQFLRRRGADARA